MKKYSCLRCHTDMRYIGREAIQLGRTGWLLGDLPNLLAGALDVNIYICPKCGKMEFFNASEDVEEMSTEELPQRTCPKCGREHDFDYPKCPYCKYEYPN